MAVADNSSNHAVLTIRCSGLSMFFAMSMPVVQWPADVVQARPSKHVHISARCGCVVRCLNRMQQLLHRII